MEHLRKHKLSLGSVVCGIVLILGGECSRERGVFTLATSFKPTCDAHDICYSVGSTTNRLDCDNVFLASLLRECERAYSAGLMRSTCRGVAQTYYTAVRTFGASYYDGAGSKA